MMDGLIAGKPFAKGKVRAATGDDEAQFVNICPCTALLALGDGDAVVLEGTLIPKACRDREGQPYAAVDVVASKVLTTYPAKRKHEAVIKPVPSATLAAALVQLEQAFGGDGEGIL